MILCLTQNYEGVTYLKSYPVIRDFSTGAVILNDFNEKVYLRKVLSSDKTCDQNLIGIDIAEIRHQKLKELFGE